MRLKAQRDGNKRLKLALAGEHNIMFLVLNTISINIPVTFIILICYRTLIKQLS